MFKISVDTPATIREAVNYLGGGENGLVMSCIEEGKRTGAVAFNIDGNFGYIEIVKTEEEVMLPVLVSAAMNFLDLHGIRTAVTDDMQHREVYLRLGFSERPATAKYPLQLSLEGYFEGGCGGKCADK